MAGLLRMIEYRANNIANVSNCLDRVSLLQRRLRLGYGRAARILDMMQRDGIIGPPDGSRPRDVLKRPDWLNEVENQLR